MCGPRDRKVCQSSPSLCCKVKYLDSYHMNCQGTLHGPLVSHRTELQEFNHTLTFPLAPPGGFWLTDWIDCPKLWSSPSNLKDNSGSLYFQCRDTNTPKAGPWNIFQSQQCVYERINTWASHHSLNITSTKSSVNSRKNHFNWLC